MKILGLETTCDETGAAVVEGEVGSKYGVRILSNIVASSVDLQQKYGGVVPEVAAREQVRVIVPVVVEAISIASQIRSTKSEIRNNFQNSKIIKWVKENVDAIALAHGPGLIGSLLIGVETAKALAVAWDKPLVAVNHLVGHVYANWLVEDGGNRGDKGMGGKALPEFPLVALIVSGGHTDLVLVKKHGDFKLLGSTLDDAAGEAFDKVAKVLGLGYPGGPEIELLTIPSLTRFAKGDKAKSVKSKLKLPRPMIGSHDFNFSFSGLKTAVVDRVKKFNYSSNDSEKFKDHDSSRFTRTISNDFQIAIAYEFQQAVVDILVTKTIKAAQKFGAKSIVVGGGVAANELLHKEFRVKGLELRVPVYFPSKNMSVDNGAMIAAAAYYNFKKVNVLKLAADPSLHFR